MTIKLTSAERDTLVRAYNSSKNHSERLNAIDFAVDSLKRMNPNAFVAAALLKITKPV